MGILSSRASKETLLSVGIVTLGGVLPLVSAGKVTEGIVLAIVGIAIIILRGILKSN